jgi:uncharacterized protein YqeY
VSLRQRIEQDIKAAMLARNEVARDTLRMVLAGMKNREIESGRDTTDEDALAVLSTAAKTRADSIAQFEQAGRTDLVAKEKAELEVVRAYLPTQMDEVEARKVVAALVAELGLSSKKDIGALMKALMARHKGSIDGKLAQRLAGEMLP